MKKNLTLTLLAMLLAIASFAVSPIVGTPSVCVGGTRTLTDSTGGGVWSSSTPSIASVGSSTGVVYGITAGVTTITYTAGGVPVTVSFTVNPTPAPIGGPTTVAAGSSITLTDATIGGAWSSACSAIFTINATSGLLTGVSAGVCTATYTLSTGCYVTRMDTVTGTGVVVLPISGSSHVCVGSTTTLMDSTSGGTWSSSNTGIATVGISSGVVTGVAAGTCTITYTVGTSYATTTIVVNPLPAAIGGPSTVAVGSAITLTDATGGGVWISSNPSIATVTSGGVVTGVAAGTVTIYYQLTTGCAVYRSVTVTGSSLLPITGTFSICVGSSTTLHDSTSGGFWSSSNPSVATAGTTTGVITGISAGVCTITYTVGTSTVTASVTVNPLPSSITGATTVAVGSAITLADATPGGTWSSSNTSVATVTSTGVVTGVSAGTVTIYYVLPTGCAVSYTITVSGSTTLPITGVNHVCLGYSTTLHDSTTGGTWSSSNTAIATVGSTTGVVVGVSAGTCTITYTHGSSFATIGFTVYPLPAAPTGLSTVAAGSSITLTDVTTGGYWTSGNTSIATVGASTGIVTGVSAGSVWIYYNLTTGCTNYKSITVTGGSTVLPITGTLTACVGMTTTLFDSTSGGTWSSSNVAIATVGSSTGIVTGVSAGACVITYAVGTSFATTTVTVSPAPSAISGPSTVAAGSSITLTDAISGGMWTSSNTSIATVNPTTGVVTGVSAGTVVIYYSFGTGCTASKTVTVTGTGILLPIFGSFNTCVGSSTTLHDSTSGGTWSSSNTAIATVGATTGVVTGIAAGVCTISYTVGTSVVTATFTVYAVPAAISGPSTVTAGSTIALTDATPGGTWVSGNTSVATVNATTGVVTGVSAGTVNIYYTTPGGCGASKTITVSGGILPISGVTHACVGTTSTLHDSTSGGTWSSSNPSIATVGATTGIVTGMAAGTCIISYTVGTTTTTVAFVVNPLPAAIAGGTTVCVGASITLTDATTGGYWMSGNTSIATVGTGTGVVTGVTAGVVNIYYSLTTGCGASKTITVNPAPSAISGSGTVCVGTTITLTDAVPGGTWTSSYVARATIGATSGIVTGVSAGTTTIVYAVGGCSTYKVITVNTAPAAITGSSSVCVGSSITLADVTTGGAWTSGTPSLATITGGGVVTGVSSGVLNIYYTVGGCSVSKTITVNAMPSAISGPSTVHTGGSPITLTDAVSGGSWFSGNTSIATVGPTTGIVTGVAAGTVNIYYSIGGCAVYKTITVLSPAPPGFDVSGSTNEQVSSFAGETEGSVAGDNTTTGVGAIVENAKVGVYPNPTSGYLNLQWEGMKTGTVAVSVTDIVGREVFRTDLAITAAAGQTQMNLSNLKDGIYMISIKTANNVVTNSLIVQH